MIFFIGISLTSSLLLLLTTFHFVQLVIELATMTTFKKLLPSIVWFLLYPISLLNFCFYNLKRQEFLSFFQQWSQLENKFNLKISNSGFFVNPIRLSHFILMCYTFLTCICLVGLAQMMINQPNSTIFLTQYLTATDNLTAVILSSAIHAAGIFLLGLTHSLCDLVPGMIFHCTGKVLRSLEQELKENFETSLMCPNSLSSTTTKPSFPTPFCNRLRKIWFKYELVNNLLERANQIFGTLIFVDHAIKFFISCALSFLLLHPPTAQDSNHDPATLAIAFAFTFRFVTSILLSAQLEISSNNLAASISMCLGNYNDRLSRRERKIVALYVNRLKKYQLAARPLDLYNINSSILLTIVGLGISYVIVLLSF